MPMMMQPNKEEDEQRKYQMVLDLVRREKQDQVAQANAAKETQEANIAQAQAKAAKFDLGANLGHGLETMIRANEVAHGGKGGDRAYWEGLKKPSAEALKVQQGLGTLHQKNINSLGSGSDLEKAGKIRKYISAGRMSPDKSEEINYKRGETEKKAFRNVTNEIRNPKEASAKTALNRIGAGKTALQTIHEFGYNMDKKNMGKLMAEVGVLTGTPGGGTDALRKSIMPSTAKADWSEMEAYLRGEPVGANQEKYVKQTEKFIKGLIKQNQERIKHYGSSIIKGSELNPEYRGKADKYLEEVMEGTHFVPQTIEEEKEEVIKVLPDGTKLRYTGVPGQEWEEI